MTFISKVKDGAINGWHTHQILPSISIAQAILESANGTSSLGAKYLNLFGIKASDDWTGKVINLPTLEYGSNGAYSTNANFRWYDSWNDSMLDHAAFFTNTPWRVINYAAVVGEKDYKRAAQALQSAGYATDPLYATKLIQRIEQNNLTQYDTEAFNGQPSNVGVIKKTVGGTLTELAKSAIKQYNVTLIGDSLGVGTQPKLMGIFRGFSHDVLGSRQITHATNSLNGTYVLQSLKDYGQLKDIVVVVLGTNRGVTDAEIDNFVAIASSGRKVIFVDTNSQVGHRQSVSDAYKRASERHNNVYFANWMNHSNSLRSRYYGSDNVHMTAEGYQAHADFIKMAVYEAGVGVKTTSGSIGTITEYIGIDEIDYKEGDLVSPKGESIIYNHPANELWGSKTGERVIWIESILEVDSDDPQFILETAVKVMKENGQPGAQYVVDLAELPDDVSIGDWGYVLDHEFNPPLYIHARVLEIITSETDINANKAVIGNVTEVFPADKSDIKLIQADLKDVRDNLVNEYRNGQPVAIVIVGSNGLTLGDKYRETELVASVMQGGKDMTNHYKDWVWERSSNDRTSDDTYNDIIATEKTNRLVVTSADVINNQSVFIARALRSDRIIAQGAIAVKHVDTAIWTGISPPSDAIDGAIWVGPTGEQKLKVGDAWEDRVTEAKATEIVKRDGTAVTFGDNLPTGGGKPGDVWFRVNPDGSQSIMRHNGTEFIETITDALSADGIRKGVMDFAEVAAINIHASSITAGHADFLTVALHAINSKLTMDGTTINILNDDGSFIELNNVPEIRSTGVDGTSVILDSGRVHFYDTLGMSKGYLGTDRHDGTRDFGVFLSKGSGTFRFAQMADAMSTVAKYYTVEPGDGRVSVVTKLVQRGELPDGDGAAFVAKGNAIATLNGWRHYPVEWPTLRTGQQIKYQEEVIETEGDAYDDIWRIGPSTSPGNPIKLYFKKEAVFEGGYSEASDRRIKHDILPTEIEALPEIEAFSFKQYAMDSDDRKVDLGLIAQESGVLRVPGEIEGVDLRMATMLALKGIQELQEVVKEQALEIEALKGVQE